MHVMSQQRHEEMLAENHVKRSIATSDHVQVKAAGQERLNETLLIK